jgi:hypothetical protein
MRAGGRTLASFCVAEQHALRLNDWPDLINCARDTNG